MSQESLPTNLASRPSEAVRLLPSPTSIAETGLSLPILADLVLKIIYFATNIPGQKIEETSKLPFPNVLDKVLEFLKQEEYIDIVGSEGGYTERSFQYTLAPKGYVKTHEALERSQYAGPAPVPLKHYLAVCRNQALSKMVVEKDTLRQAFGHMVLSESLLDRLGPATNSARSLFLYGPPGNGKTMIAEVLAQLLMASGNILIPYALEVEGWLVRLFDPLNHQAIEQPNQPEAQSLFTNAPKSLGDARWVVCKRPQVIVGSELSMEQLDFTFDPLQKIYEAPFQLKANGGLFLIDDLGRQKCSAVELLNRWIVPLEKRTDFLALQTGKKVIVPFDVLLVLSTNLSPKDLVDDAFLRRIRYKIEVPNPKPPEFREIFRRTTQLKQIPYSDDGLRYLIQEHYFKTGRDLRCCHPRDLCDQILDEAKYRGIQPEMSKELLDRACEAYFVKLG